MDDGQTKILYAPSVPTIFPQMQKSFPSVLPKSVYPVSLRMYNKSAQRKSAKHKKTHVAKFQSEFCLLSLKRTTWKQKRDILASDKAYSSSKLLFFPSLSICFDMEQFVLVLAFVFNIYLITQSVTKQKLPKYQPSQKPTYQTDSLKKEINKKLFSKAGSLADKILSCPRIKLSISQIFFWMV